MPTSQMVQSASCAAWITAALRGVVGVEQALDMLISSASAPVVFHVNEPDPDTFAHSIQRWRRQGVTGWRYAPAAPGDAAGVPGPASVRSAAIDAGAALVSVDGASLGLLPLADADARELQGRKGFPLRELATEDHGVGAPETLADVDRTLLTTLTESITALEQLDVARWREDVRDLLAGWSGEPAMPPGTDPRAISIAARSQRVLELVDLANDDHGGSRTSREISERASALRELSRTARAAHAAAWNTGLRETGRRR